MDHPHPNRDSGDTGRPRAGQLLQRAFARHEAELFGMLCFLIGSSEGARDALQETFAKCWRHRRGNTESDNLRPWIFRMALNAGRDMRASLWHHRRPAPTEAAFAADGLQAEADAARRELLVRVRHALRQLRPQEQEVFLLRQNAQMSYEQIAHAMDLPIPAVKSRMRVALRKLREVLVSRA